MSVETTKQKILTEALKLFSQNGYEAVSVEQIANAVGIKAPSLYKHYKGKRDIFNHILERMNEMDLERAKKYEMPEGDLEKIASAYSETPIEKIKTYSVSLFLHWTEEEFSGNFRKMLTLEQYRNPEMSQLYQQYLSSGPLQYMAELFGTMTGKINDSMQLALAFYGPIFLLYSAYDGAGDKEEMIAALKQHIDRFSQQMGSAMRKGAEEWKVPLTMQREDFPILEFDEDKNVFIRPACIFKPIDIPERCVLCNFGEAINQILEECPHRVVTYFEAESIKLPVYELDYKGEKIALVQAYVGAPGAAVQIEVLTALGCCKYMACGGCGVLQKDLAIGHLIIPTNAVRDEGTSYHYVKPAREITANEHVVNVIENTLIQRGVPYIKAKTWTTDAFYRETPAKIQQRIRENCVTVDMKASAYIAVSQYNNVDFGQILYAGDNLAGAEWDRRDWDSQAGIRENVLRIALDACLSM